MPSQPSRGRLPDGRDLRVLCGGWAIGCFAPPLLRGWIDGYRPGFVSGRVAGVKRRGVADFPHSAVGFPLIPAVRMPLRVWPPCLP
jgi:hypothetical protein